MEEREVRAQEPKTTDCPGPYVYPRGPAPLYRPRPPSRPAATGNSSLRTFRRHLDRVLPPNRTYFGRARRFLLLAILVFLVLLLALILGIAIPLTHPFSSAPDISTLPLPDGPLGHGPFDGELTYYAPALGACGINSTSKDNITAVAHTVFDAAASSVAGASGNPNKNPLCGRKIRVMRDYFEVGAGNRTVEVTVVDRCAGCEPMDLDLAPKVFDVLAPEGKGRVVGSWEWL